MSGCPSHGFFDKVDAIVAEEHLFINEKGGKTKRATCQGFIAIRFQAPLDRIVLRGGDEGFAIEASGIQRVADDLWFSEVQLLHPHTPPHSLMKCLEAPHILGDERSTHDVDAAHGKERVRIHGYLEALCPTRYVVLVVGDLRGNRRWWCVFRLDDHYAKNGWPIQQSRAGALDHASHAVIREIGEGTGVVVEELNRGHGFPCVVCQLAQSVCRRRRGVNASRDVAIACYIALRCASAHTVLEPIGPSWS